MKKKRLPQTVTKVKTPFRRGNVFILLTWDGDRVVGASLSHQQPDLEAPVAEALEAISTALCAAIKAGP